MPWQLGERHFRDTLADYDPALNAFNWQWVAGSGTDAAGGGSAAGAPFGDRPRHARVVTPADDRLEGIQVAIGLIEQLGHWAILPGIPNPLFG